MRNRSIVVSYLRRFCSQADGARPCRPAAAVPTKRSSLGSCLSPLGLALALSGLAGSAYGQAENIQQILYGGPSGSHNGSWYGASNWYEIAFIGGQTTFYYDQPLGTENRTQIINAQVDLAPVQTNPLTPPAHYDAVTGKYFDLENSTLSIHGDVTLNSKFVYLGSGIGSTANVTISGPNALWVATGADDVVLGPSNLYVGMANDSQATLTIASGATVQIPNRGLSLGYGDRSTGTLNIGNYDRTTTGGNLSIYTGTYGYVTFGNSIGVVGQDGHGIINFNQTDTVWFSSRLNSAKPGLGQIVQRGTGMTLLDGDNSGFSGQVEVDSGTLWLRGNMGAAFYNIAGGALRVTADQFNSSTAYIAGAGTLQIGSGNGGLNGAMVFAMSGGLIDLDRAYTTGSFSDPISFSGSNGGNENWTLNKSSLRVGFGATFWGNEGAIRVDALSGTGTIRSGYAGLGSFTFGVNNGSGIFSGVLADGDTASGHIGHYFKVGSGTQTLTGVNTFTGGLAVNGGFVQVISDSNLGAASSPLALNAGGVRFGAAFNDLRGFTIGNGGGWLDTNGYNVTVAQNISGSGALNKQGAGTLTLTGTNSQTGIYIMQGTVAVAADQSLGAAGTFVNLDGGTLAATQSIGIDRPLTIGTSSNTGNISVPAGKLVSWTGSISGGANSTLTKSDTGALWLWGDGSLGSVQVNGGMLVTLGTLNLGKNAVIAGGANLVLNYDTNGAGGDRYYTGNTTFSGAGTLTKTGDGDVHWGYDASSGAATFALSSGSLIDVQVGAFSGSNGGNETWTNNLSDLRVNSGATFYGNEGYIRVDALSDGFSGGGTIKSGWAGAGSVTFGVDNGSGTFSGVLADTDKAAGHIGTFIKDGTGTQTLTGNNTYTGPTTVINGTLVLTGDTKSPAFTLGLGAATLEFNLATDHDYGSVKFDGFGILKKTGPGRLYWGTGQASFAMSTGSKIDVQAGTFTGGSNNNDSWLNNKSDLNVATGATFEGVEADVRVDALTGGGTITSGYSSAEPGSFTFGVDNGSGTFSGVLANGSNPGRFIKAGTGTQIITGANTFSGGLTISGGTLQIGAGGTTGSVSSNITNNASLVFNRSDSSTYSGVISGSGAVTKQGSGMLTLTGANTFTGTLTINEGGIQLGANGNVLSNTGTIKLVGGTLALGAPMETIGTLSITGGTLAFDLTSSTSYERLVASSITLTGGTLRLTLAGGYQPVAGATFDILDWSSKSGTFATLDLPALANGLAWNTSSLYTNGTLSVTAVPEPGTLALVAFSALLLTFSRFVPRRERIRLRQPSRR